MFSLNAWRVHHSPFLFAAPLSRLWLEVPRHNIFYLPELLLLPPHRAVLPFSRVAGVTSHPLTLQATPSHRCDSVRVCWLKIRGYIPREGKRSILYVVIACELGGAWGGKSNVLVFFRESRSTDPNLNNLDLCEVSVQGNCPQGSAGSTVSQLLWMFHISRFSPSAQPLIVLHTVGRARFGPFKSGLLPSNCKRLYILCGYDWRSLSREIRKITQQGESSKSGWRDSGAGALAPLRSRQLETR